MGIYDTHFTSVPHCDQLLINYPSRVTHDEVWLHLNRGWNYKLDLTKASRLIQLAHKYVHVVMSRLVQDGGTTKG